MSPDLKRLIDIFFPEASAATTRVNQNGGRFVYYTTAETAYQIIKNNEFWMRSTMTMNDFSEVRHGLDAVVSAYRGPPGQLLDQVRISAIADGCFSLIADAVSG